MKPFRRTLRFWHTFFPAVFCIATVFPAQALAQRSDSVVNSVAPPTAFDDEDVVILETFEVSSNSDRGYYSGNTASATRLDTPINETAQSIYVLNQEFLRDMAATDLSDMIAYAPEMSMGETGDDRLGMSMRGTSVGDPLINGVSRVSRGTISSMANIERAEIVAGPSSIFLANDMGIGGGINLSTKKPRFDRPASSLELQMKSGNTGRFVYDYASPFARGSRWAWRAIVEGLEGEEEDGYVEDLASKKRIGLMPSVAWRSRSKRTSLFLLGEIFYQKTNRPKGADLIRANNIIQVPVDVNVNSGLDTMQRNQYSLQALFMHALGNSWAVRATTMVTYNDNVKNWMANTYQGYANAAQGLIAFPRTLVEESHEHRTNYALQVDLAGTFNTGPFKHQFIVGSDLKYNTSKTAFAHSVFATEDQIFDIYHPDYDVTLGPKTPHRRVNNRSTRTNFYASENIKAFKDRLIINLGVRASDFSNVGDREWYFPKAEPPHVEVPTKWGVTPKAGIVIKIINPVSLYYSYAETFQPHDHTNPDDTFIEPETGAQHETGVKTHLVNGRLIFNTSVYQLLRENVAYDTYPAEWGGSVAYWLTDKSIRVRGWNLNCNLTPFAGLQLNGSLTMVDPEVVAAGPTQTAQLGQRPKNLAEIRYNWNIRYEFRKGLMRGFTAAFFHTHVGDRPADFARNGVQPFITPAYDTYSAMVRYARKKWSLQLNVNNILDTRNYTYAEYDSNGGNGTIRRAPPREFHVTYRREF